MRSMPALPGILAWSYTMTRMSPNLRSDAEVASRSRQTWFVKAYVKRNLQGRFIRGLGVRV